MTQHAELATMAVMIRDGVLLLAPVYHKQDYRPLGFEDRATFRTFCSGPHQPRMEYRQ